MREVIWMCTKPSGVTEALTMARAGLSFLATCDPAALPTATQAETLAGLERAEAALTAARAAALSAFCAGHGYEADGQFGPKPWLRAFTRVTKGAAAGAMAWMGRLQSHPLIAEALAGEAISASWAREVCSWTDRLPPGLIKDADQILLAAAAAGADLPGLALLADEMLARAATPDEDGDGFADRSLWLDRTLAGAGHLTGDLTPACAAALSVVLDALGAKAGPEDTRSAAQRRHDALEEACQRLIAANVLPGRDGQPLHVYAHMDLARLAALAGQPTGAQAAKGCSALEGLWSLAGPEAAAAACDATVIPVITGHLDWSLADDLIAMALPVPAFAHDQGGPPASPGDLLTPAVRQHLRDLVAEHAVALLSGPTGLAARLRARDLPHPMAGPSQPLDLGPATPIIPSHLRRAVTFRDGHCRFPGCAQPATVCHIHHLRPRAQGGPTALANLALLCRFHHLIAVHRWGWALACHPDGTATATAPDGRILHSHSPPRQAA
jgi:Domain of unknown function (DUF222)/HNH endonuclease